MSAVKNNIKWALLCSGWGKNAADLIEAYSKGLRNEFTITMVIYDQEPCGAAEAANKHGIAHLQIIKKDFPNILSYQKKIKEELEKRQIDCIFLLGYQYLIGKDLLECYPNRILNVHPSLFPSFLATKTAIQDAIDYGVKVSGITTHIIDDKYDRGIILYQTPIRIKPDDTFETLYPKFSRKGLKLIIKSMRLMRRYYE